VSWFSSCVLVRLLSLLVLAEALAGCTASGVPRFVKISRDGRWLIYEDQTYPKAYVRDLGSRKQYTFNGSVACIGPDADQFVLTPWRLNWPYPRAGRVGLLLVELGDDPPGVMALPTLETEHGHPQLHLAFSGRRALRAASYAPGYLTDSSEPSARLQLADWQSEWEPDTDENVEPGDPPSVWRYLPDGVERGGFAIAPHSLENGGFAWGPDAEQEWHGSHVVRLLRSPDRRYVICVHDDADLWRRMTLTDLNGGKREVILDKDDGDWGVFLAALSVLTFPVWFPVLSFMAP
jgi:hypothetical protein